MSLIKTLAQLAEFKFSVHANKRIGITEPDGSQRESWAHWTFEFNGMPCMFVVETLRQPEGNWFWMLQATSRPHGPQSLDYLFSFQSLHLFPSESRAIANFEQFVDIFASI